MSATEGLRKGMVIRHEGQVYVIDDFHVAQSGKQRPTVHLKLRHVHNGNPADRTLDQIGKIDEVPAEHREMQYLYHTGSEYVFMDTNSFEQFPFEKTFVGDAHDFLHEEDKYRFLFVDNEPVSLDLPDVLVFEVVDTAPVEHAGGSTNVHKEAKLSSGLTVQVPLFIKNGDRIRVKTDSRQYVGKEH